MRTAQGRHRHQWRKSSYSSDTGGDCVECATLAPAAVAVRNSKRPDHRHLTIPAAGFAAFVRAVADDTLD